MKYAVVTGGTSIGLGVVKMLIQKRYYVFATYAFNDIDENNNIY